MSGAPNGVWAALTAPHSPVGVTTRCLRLAALPGSGRRFTELIPESGRRRAAAPVTSASRRASAASGWPDPGRRRGSTLTGRRRVEMPLQISLLGAQSITDDSSGIVRTRSSRTMALVGFLVLHADVPQPRQRLAGLFWPDSTDTQALTNLRRELHHLRRTLGDDPCLEVTAKDLCWRDGDTIRVDVRTFERESRAALAAIDAEVALGHAGSALAAYGGELLPGL